MRAQNRWLLLLLRVVVVVVVSGLLIAIPENWLAEADSIVRYKNAIVVLCGIVVAGKFLYDTLFYERLPM